MQKKDSSAAVLQQISPTDSPSRPTWWISSSAELSLSPDVWVRWLMGIIILENFDMFGRFETANYSSHPRNPIVMTHKMNIIPIAYNYEAYIYIYIYIYRIAYNYLSFRNDNMIPSSSMCINIVSSPCQ